MLRGEKEKKDVTNVDTHTDRQTDTQTEKGVNPTSRYSTGFSISFWAWALKMAKWHKCSGL